VVKTRWTIGNIVKSVSFFVNEVGYFPRKKDFNNLSFLPSYSVFRSINVGNNIYEIEKIKEKIEKQKMKYPFISYPSTANIIMKEYRNMTADLYSSLCVLDTSLFYVFILDDRYKMSFFDAPFILSRKKRYEEAIMKGILPIKNTYENKYFLLNNVLVGNKNTNKRKMEEKSIDDFLDKLLVNY